MISAVHVLQDALKQSQEILKLAENKEWELLEIQLKQRDQILKEVLAQKIATEEANKVRELIAKIKETDTKISVFVESQRNAVSQEINKQQKGKKMQAAYNKTKRPY